MNEVTRGEVNGLGARVNKMEAFKSVQEKENEFIHKDIKTNKVDISNLYTIMDGISRMTYKIIGGVAVIVVVAQLFTIWMIS